MIVTRFAPSPTGLLHLGNLRAALFNWAMARRAGGKFILRFDDTDSERSRPEFVDAIRTDLDWLGIGWDTEVRQSARSDLYAEAAERLRASERLYACFETAEELELRRRIQRAQGRPPVYERTALRLEPAERAALAHERTPHWRFLLSQGRVAWTDGILGAQAVETGSVSDPVLIRADGVVLYTLASVVDDADLGITDVVRGADHITNTAVQLEIFAAHGAHAPGFAHHALMTMPGGAALSKRMAGLSLRDLREAGVEPLALMSLMARLGSADPVEPRLSLDDIVAGFDLTRFGAAPTVLDPDEPARLSAKILQALDSDAVAPRLETLGIPRADAARLWPVVRANVTQLADAASWFAICQDGVDTDPAGEDAAFVAKALALLPDPPWTEQSWADWTSAVKSQTGRKGRALFQPLRHALTGRERGPEMAQLMPLMRQRPRLVTGSAAS
ncbi:MAG: glutamate--tRNA ligase [Pseudomonadota bacterium]